MPEAILPFTSVCDFAFAGLVNPISVPQPILDLTLVSGVIGPGVLPLPLQDILMEPALVNDLILPDELAVAMEEAHLKLPLVRVPIHEDDLSFWRVFIRG